MSDKSLEIILTAKDITGKAFTSLQNRITGIARAATSLQGVIAAAGLGLTAKSFLDTATAFERYETQLKTLTGSSEKAKSAMDWIADFAKSTPYELDQVTAAFSKLTAYGFNATQYIGMLGDTASSMGKDLNDAVEMFADAATGEFERLKEFGVRAKQQGDQVTFSWSQNGQDMVLTAQKTQSGITSALNQIFARFKGGMDEQSRTFTGLWSNFNDQITDLQRRVMDAGIFDELKTQLAGINQAMSAWVGANSELIKQRVPEYIEKIKSSLQTVWDMVSYDPDILSYGIVGLAVGGKKGAALVGGMAHMVNWAGNLTRAFELSAAGLIEFSDIAKANFKELEDLIAPYNNARVGENGQLFYKVPTTPATTGTKGTSTTTTTTTTRVAPPVDTMSVKEGEEALKSFYTAYDEWVTKLDADTKRVLGIGDDLREFFADLDADEKNLKIDTDLNAFFNDLDVENAKLKDHYQRMIDLSQHTAEAMQDSFSEFFFDAMQGKMDSLGDYITSFLTSVQRSLASAFSGQLTESITNSNWWSSLFHSGGVVGQDTGSGRSVPAAVFAGAPRLHSGLMPDEYPAILQRGEAVLTRGQLKAVAGAGANVNFKVEVKNETGRDVQASVTQPQFDGVQYVSYLMLRAVQDDVNGWGRLVGGR